MESDNNNQPKEPNLSDNPYLKENNPYEDYAKSQQANLQSKHAQEVMKLQKDCYMMMQTPEAQECFKGLTARFMLQTLYNPIQAGVEHVALYWEGFRDAIRTVGQMSDMHAQMINEQK
jgi:hypothetical protein